MDVRRDELARRLTGDSGNLGCRHLSLHVDTVNLNFKLIYVGPVDCKVYLTCQIRPVRFILKLKKGEV